MTTKPNFFHHYSIWLCLCHLAIESALNISFQICIFPTPKGLTCCFMYHAMLPISSLFYAVEKEESKLNSQTEHSLTPQHYPRATFTLTQNSPSNIQHPPLKPVHRNFISTKSRREISRSKHSVNHGLKATELFSRNGGKHLFSLLR